MSDSKPQFVIKKSYKDGHIAVGIILRCRAWHTGNANMKLDGSTDISSAEARELAKSLIEQADAADAKVAKKKKHEENRRKYLDREIASGRMIQLKGLR